MNARDRLVHLKYVWPALLFRHIHPLLRFSYSNNVLRLHGRVIINITPLLIEAVRINIRERPSWVRQNFLLKTREHEALKKRQSCIIWCMKIVLLLHLHLSPESSTCRRMWMKQISGVCVCEVSFLHGLYVSETDACYWIVFFFINYANIPTGGHT